jgi:hypothetical protein
MTIRNKIKTKAKKVYDSLVVGDEPALAIGWLNIGKLLFFTMFLFITLDSLMDSGYLYIHHASPSFYNDTDVKAVDDLYGVYKWIPIVPLSVGLVFIINYSNLLKGD